MMWYVTESEVEIAPPPQQIVPARADVAETKADEPEPAAAEEPEAEGEGAILGPCLE